MENFFFCYNYLTLSKAMYYIDNKLMDDSNTIVYLESVLPFPSAVKKEYNVMCMEGFLEKKSFESNHFESLQSLIKSIRRGRLFMKYADFVTKTVIDTAKKCECTLYYFSDNGIAEIILDRVFEAVKTPDRLKCILIEEGLALYSTNGSVDRSIKYYIKRLLGIKRCILNPQLMGMNKHLSEVWCSDPEGFMKKRNDIMVIREDYIFTPEHSKKLMRLFSSTESLELPDDIRFIFVTQPLTYTDEMKKTFKMVMDVLSSYGKILIKKHPRDKFDYSIFENENVLVSSNQLQRIPFECIYNNFDDIILLTYYSSAAIVPNANHKPIFLYKLFCPAETVEMINNFEINWNDLLVCNSIDNLNNIIGGTIDV